MKKIPVWLFYWVSNSLLGEIYPAIRGIAVSWNDEKKSLILRYYLDREPIDEDVENINVVIANILANTTSNDDIKEIKDELIYTTDMIKDLDSLSGFLYLRMEVY